MVRDEVAGSVPALILSDHGEAAVTASTAYFNMLPLSLATVSELVDQGFHLRSHGGKIKDRGPERIAAPLRYSSLGPLLV